MEQHLQTSEPIGTSSDPRPPYGAGYVLEEVPRSAIGRFVPWSPGSSGSLGAGSAPTPTQAPPKPGATPVTEQVIQDLRTRTERGISKYGRPLETFNGRSALQDAYEEALDLAQYLKQLLMEETRLNQAGRCPTCGL